MIERGTQVRAKFNDGQWYPATYVAERAGGVHRVTWADGSGVAEVSTVEPIGEVAKGKGSGSGKAPRPKTPKSPRGGGGPPSPAREWNSHSFRKIDDDFSPVYNTKAGDEQRSVADHHLKQAALHERAAAWSQNKDMKMHHDNTAAWHRSQASNLQAMANG